MEYRNGGNLTHHGKGMAFSVDAAEGVEVQGSTIAAISDASTADLTIRAKGAGIFTVGNASNETHIALAMDSNTTTGLITKGGTRFIHNYADATADGRNTFVGIGAGNFTLSPGGGAANLASNNSGFGYGTLAALTTGSYNTALGKLTLAVTTTGGFNTAVGGDALSSNTSGENNTAVGVDALQLNTDGIRNTAVGVNALVLNTSGDQNTAIGMSSLFVATAANSCTGVGYGALSGYASGFQVTAVGYLAGASLTGGNFSTFLGNEAGSHASQKVDAANSMALGNGSYTTANNQVVIGNASVTDVILGSVSAAAQLSAASVRGKAVTYANRPGTPVEGMLVAITDSNTATWGATIAGGGANHVLAYYNGTNWTVAAV